MITVVENYTSPTSWYRKWSNGLIEQGGVIMRSWGTDSSYVLTFPKAFEHYPLTIKVTFIAVPNADSDGGEPGVKNGTLSNTGVTVLCDNYGTNKTGIYWEAKGF